MHVFVIDFMFVQIWGLLLFLQEYLQDQHSMSDTCMLKRHNAYSLSRMHVPVMRWKFLSCPWNAVKNRMSLVVLTA